MSVEGNRVERATELVLSMISCCKKTDVLLALTLATQRLQLPEQGC